MKYRIDSNQQIERKLIESVQPAFKYSLSNQTNPATVAAPRYDGTTGTAPNPPPHNQLYLRLVITSTTNMSPVDIRKINYLHIKQAELWICDLLKVTTQGAKLESNSRPFDHGSGALPAAPLVLR